MFQVNLGLRKSLKKIWTSKSGSVLVYIAFGLPILLGTMALSIDLGRAFILNTELKDFSDAAALAGAAELDGRDGARNAAFLAATTGLEGTLVNIQAFATDGSGPNIAVENVVFLRNLPADGTDFDNDDVATSDANARFIFVSVVDRNVRSGLSRALGVIPDFNTDARSIAGYIAVVCRVPAMFMCNPLEDEAFPTPDGVDCILGEGAPLLGQDDCLKRRQMLLTSGQGGGGKYFPGEFGLLECPEAMQEEFGKGAKCAAESVAQVAPPNCVGDRAFVKTGKNTGPITSAINVRFDHYSSQFGGNKSNKADAPRNNHNYAPALNVTKGWKESAKAGKGCSEPPDPDNPLDITAPLPRDTCFDPGKTCAGNGRYGDGDWHDGVRDVEYWETNHGNSAMSNPPAGYASMTRYDVYRLEIQSEMDGTAPGIPEPAPSPGGPTLEDGKACNYIGGNPNDPAGGGFTDPIIASSGIESIDRRLLYLAAINCVEHGPLHGASSNNPDGLPIEGVVEIFLTEPASVPGEKAGEESAGNDKHNIWGEIQGIVDSEYDGLRDIVQLYR
jgi:Flp pilus assembly protein TadG